MPKPLFYFIAQQNPDQGRTWDFVAGPYASEAMAKGNQEYAARHHQPAWFEGASISVVHTDMRIPTALGPLEAKERSPAATENTMPDSYEERVRANQREKIAEDHDDMPTPEEWRKLESEWTHDYGLRRLEERGVKYEDQVERKLDHAAARDRDAGHREERPPSPEGAAPARAAMPDSSDRALFQRRDAAEGIDR